MKVSELAKSLKLKTEDLLKTLKELGIDAKSPSSVISKENAQIVKDLSKKKSDKKETAKNADKKSAKKVTAKKAAAEKPESKKTPVVKKPAKVAEESTEKVKADIKQAIPPVEEKKVEEPVKKTITLAGKDVTVKDLSDLLKMRVSDVIKELMKTGIMATINQRIDVNIARKIASVFDYNVLLKTSEAPTMKGLREEKKDEAAKMSTRPPIVVVMGHVDHGKTKLLDAIRKTNVMEKEAGGITQHIGAYQVEVHGKKVTFLDTPGHEAFTALRARGAKVTDIAVLVVAADDGVKPQTIEAIDHAKAAGVPIIVAINKIDKPDANIDKTKQQLSEQGLLAEDWGGSTVTVPISAKAGKNINELLEMILLVAELQELKANPLRHASGIIIEAKLDKGKGPVATVLIGNGTLKVGDSFYVGSVFGKVRALINDKGERINAAPPSTPVEVLGATEVPQPGEVFRVHEERIAKKLAESRKFELQKEKIIKGKIVSLEDFSKSVKEGKRKDLNIILKADVGGSLEALRKMILPLTTEDIKINIIHSIVGDISEGDIMLAKASSAIVIGFNVGYQGNAKELAEKEGIDSRVYDIIYRINDDLKLAMEGMLETEYEEMKVGQAVVKSTFKYSKLGVIAGCFVEDGKMIRNANMKVIRDGKIIYTGKLESLKRFKEDAKEVEKGFECGIAIKGHSDFKEGDIIEVFELRAKPRKKI